MQPLRFYIKLITVKIMSKKFLPASYNRSMCYINNNICSICINVNCIDTKGYNNRVSLIHIFKQINEEYQTEYWWTMSSKYECGTSSIHCDVLKDPDQNMMIKPVSSLKKFWLFYLEAFCLFTTIASHWPHSPCEVSAARHHRSPFDLLISVNDEIISIIC